MERKQVSATPTQHALVVVWGEFAQTIGLTEQMMAVKVGQKQREHTAQRKVLEMLVATLMGLPHLQDISRSAHPLDQDRATAEAWQQSQWADYSGVSRSLQGLTMKEAQQFKACLQAVSQPFIDAEVAKALEQSGRLVYDGDLSGIPVSKSSTTYPGAAYGHMDDCIQFGYQVALVSMHSPTYGRLGLSIEHHPGNALSAHQALAMIQAAEAATRRRPWRRVDLLEQRLNSLEAAGAALQQRLEEHQGMRVQAQAACDQTREQLQALQAEVAQLEQTYQARQRVERPTGQLALARKRLQVQQERLPRREKAVTQAIHLCQWSQGRIQEHQDQLQQLRCRLEALQQENAANPAPIRAAFRLDAGFGTWENLALLIEMGYEVYTKAFNHMSVHALHEKLVDPAAWQTVGVKAEMQAYADILPDKFCYRLDVGLERFQFGENVWKNSALLHFGPDPVTQDCQRWFNGYNQRQTMEAGIKESKHVFCLHRIKVRSLPAIVLQEAFVLFAANFIRWASRWIADHCSGSAKADCEHPRVGTKRLIRVLAHTSAEIKRSADMCLVRFSPMSCLAGKELRLPGRSTLQKNRSGKVQFFQEFRRFTLWLHNS